MLKSRIIPCLLIHNNGLVKTVKFGAHKYVGDPINAVKIFNEKEVDELMVLDIDASVYGRKPNMGLIKNLAAECRMPLCYGGGITTSKEAQEIIELGVEKVSISAALFNRFDLISEIGSAIGLQSVVVVLDVKKSLLGNSYSIYTHNGKKRVSIELDKILSDINRIGVGEVVINSIDLDGTMQGYDMSLIDYVRQRLDMPLTVLGGAGSIDDLKKVVNKYKIIGAAAGSLFVFKGKLKAVLINYPSKEEKELINNNY